MIKIYYNNTELNLLRRHYPTYDLDMGVSVWGDGDLLMCDVFFFNILFTDCKYRGELEERMIETGASTTDKPALITHNDVRNFS